MPNANGHCCWSSNALDAAGKDSTIKHVLSGVNPQGCMSPLLKHPVHVS